MAGRTLTEKRLALVKQRIKELEAAKASGEARKGYFGSKYYADSVVAGAPLFPTSSASEYLQRRNKSSVQGYVEQMLPALDAIPSTLGSRSLRPHPVHIGIIADEFLYKSFDATAQLSVVTPSNYLEVAEDVDLLIVASTWRGQNDVWKGLPALNSQIRAFLIDQVIPHFKERNLPVVFYSKEDPPNYDQFLAVAQAADYVFTCAEEVVADYIKDCPDAKSVQSLSFGVNPLHHSPVYSRRHRLQEVLFAGSWHVNKYPERRLAARKIFDGVIESSRDLVIFDRNWDLENGRYFFPDEYIPYLAPAVEHGTLLKLQKFADFNINLNSVVASETMYANRVIELQAMGSMVISSYNIGVNNKFPNVLTAEASSDVRDTIDRISDSDLYEVQMEGVRRAYSDHLAHDRMADILRTVGINHLTDVPRICAVVDTTTDHLPKVISEQTVRNVSVIRKSELESRRGDFDIAVPFSSEYVYAPTHIEDLCNGFKYADVDFVTKSLSRHAASAEHEPTSFLPDPAAGAIWLNSPAGAQYAEGANVRGSGYAMDSLGLSSFSDRIDLGGSAGRLDEPDYLVSVIVPVYNNGPYLLNKCIRSLSRSSIFHRMQILLVDDGSTDLRTKQILEELTGKYSQVTVFSFEPGGSGSASRARNKGLDLATAPWITYLDPDNEAVSDGYARLIEIAAQRSSDLVVGDMLKFSDAQQRFKYARRLRQHLTSAEDGSLVPQEDILLRLEFYPMSIQAMVMNAEWLKGLGLQQPVGALGQDSFFFQQLVHYAQRIDVLELPIHVYYGSVSKSVVNTIGPNFFKKYLPLEAARSSWLEEIGAIELYKQTRGQSFMKLWYLRKLQQVDAGDLEECTALVRQLAAFYNPVVWEDAEVNRVLTGGE